jgi:hypothetical protein
MARKVDLRGAKDAKGDTVLHFAACKGSLEICKFLVEESGLDVDSPSKTGAPGKHLLEIQPSCILVRESLFCFTTRCSVPLVR